MSNHRILLLPALLAMAACSPSDPATEAEVAADTAQSPQTAEPAITEPLATEPAADADMGATATARLQATEGNAVSGELTLSAENGVVRLRGAIAGLQPDSVHGFHVHEHGDCSAPDGTSAGGHFNPTASSHGRAGRGEHHVGDSDNIRADAEGVATVDAELHGASLGDGADTDVAGKAVIVHAGQDDYTSQPTGDAGARLACGVIELQ